MAVTLLIFGIAAVWADCATTLIGLRRGLHETNPLMPTTTPGVLIVAGLATVALGLAFSVSARRALETTRVDITNGFALVVHDDSMAPMMRFGDFAFFDRSLTTLRHGEVHLVDFCQQGQIRAVRTPSCGGIELVAVNPLYGTIRLECDERCHVRSLGRLIVVHNVNRF